MTIEKLDQTSPDLTKQNVERLAERFPECVTEGPTGDGPHIDFNLLRQALSGHLVEGPAERYRLDWPGKRRSLLIANTPTTKTLRPAREDSVDFDTTRNLFIEGDNLEALKLLQETYLGKVKMIYIDPPYNTGKDFIYKDKFARGVGEELAESGQVDEEGGRLVANTEANGRFHSDWLSMMYPRLKLARSLLRDDGILFVSVDENEVDNLHKLCVEVFGHGSFLFQITILSNPKGRSQDKYVANCHEYALAFSRSALEKGALDVPKSDEEISADYPLTDDNGRYRELELRNTHREFGKFNRPNLHYPFYVNENMVISLDEKPGYNPVYPNWDDGFEGCWTWGKSKASSELSDLVAKDVRGTTKIFRKGYANRDGETATKQLKSIWTGRQYHTENGQKRFNQLFGVREKLFQSPKPIGTLRSIIEMSTGSSDIIMDFFAGSASTVDACMSLNAESNRKNKYIVVQYPELVDDNEPARDAGYENIAQLSRERIRRAGAKILEDRPEERGKLDVGFRTLRIDSSNLRDTRVAADGASQDDLTGMVDVVKPDRTDEDLLFGALLSWGVDLTLPLRRTEVLGREVHLVDAPEDSDEGAALIACFARDVDRELAAALARLTPLRVLFRDDGFPDDAARENVESTFQQLAPTTTVRVI